MWEKSKNSANTLKFVFTRAQPLLYTQCDQDKGNVSIYSVICLNVEEDSRDIQDWSSNKKSFELYNEPH